MGLYITPILKLLGGPPCFMMFLLKHVRTFMSKNSHREDEQNERFSESAASESSDDEDWVGTAHNPTSGG